MKNRNIVVPIDFSKESLNGLKFAMVFAKKMNADITMVYVQRKSLSSHMYVSVADEKAWATKQFEELVAKNRSKIKNRFDYKIRKGKIYEEVVNQAKYNDSSMIICTTHGVSGFEEFFIGSNAFRFVSSAECPVVTLRKGVCPPDIKKIVVPIDITVESRQKVPVVADIASFFNAELHIVSVATSSSKENKNTLKVYVDQVEKYLKNKKIKYVSKELIASNISKAIIEYANEINAELITIMTEQEYATSNLLIGPFAQQTVNHSNIPVMSVHPRQISDLDVFKY